MVMQLSRRNEEGPDQVAQSGVSKPRPMGRMWPGMAMKVAQHETVNLLKTFFFFAHQVSLVFVYVMGGSRQLFFFQCGPEMPKGWTPL